MPELVSKKLVSRIKPKKRSKSSWKNNKSKSSNKIGLAIAALAFLVLLVLTGKFIIFIGNLFKSDNGGSGGVGRNYNWDGHSVLNLAVEADGVYILSFNPIDQKVEILKVPDQTYLDLPLGFGSWPARSVYSLGESENPPIGSMLLKKTLTSNFGIPIDGYLVQSDMANKSITFEKFFDDSRKDPIGFISILRSYRTDLSPYELIQFWLGVKGVRFDKIHYKDLEQTSLTTSKLLADGSRSLSLDPIKVDSLMESYFEEPKLSDEMFTIGIYNSTDQPGLAEKAARLINNIGGRVVFTSNSTVSLDQTIVLGKDSYTRTRLSQIFAPNCLTKSSLFGLVKSGGGCSYPDTKLDQGRSDITIILGKDFISQTTKPGSISK